MAARRLVVVMLVLLLLSSLAAALAPIEQPDEGGATTGTTATTTTRDPPEQGAQPVEADLDARAAHPGTVRARVGDQLQLRVSAGRPAIVEIPRLGAVDAAAPLDPARFDLLLRDPGSYRVRLVEPARTVGTIEVSSRARRGRAADRARESP